MKYLLLILLLIFNFAQAKNNIVYLGAGGEDANKEDTIFDDGAVLFGKFYSKVKTNYDTIVAFNGGHKKTEAIIKKGFNGAKIEKSFDKKTYDKIIADLKNKLSKDPPDIKPGEKIMLFIDTHGSAKNDNQLAHNVSLAGGAIEDYNAGSSPEDSLDLSSLKELTELAEKKNVNMAIIDGSCHSGNTLALANSKTCVISGSLPNQYATDLTNFLAQKMRSGISIEEAFIQARAEADGTPFPMISSPAGMKVQNDLKGIIPFLFYHEKIDDNFALDKIDNYFIAEANSNNDCKRNTETDELFRMLDFIKELNKKLKGKSQINFQALKTKVKNYKEIHDSYISKIRATKITTSFLNESIEVNTEGLKQRVTRKDILATDYPGMIADKKADIAKMSDPKEMAHHTRYLKFYEKLNEEKTKLIANSKVTEYQQLIESIKKDERLFPDSFAKIGEEMRKVYTNYYRQTAKEMSEVSNPCTDFKI